MKNRSSILSMFGLAAFMIAAVAFAAPTSSGVAKAKIGEAAPNFTLNDADSLRKAMGTLLRFDQPTSVPLTQPHVGR